MLVFQYSDMTNDEEETDSHKQTSLTPRNGISPNYSQLI